MDSNSSKEDATFSEEMEEIQCNGNEVVVDTMENDQATGVAENLMSESEAKVSDMEPSTSSGATGGATGIDKLLHQQKNEIMFELRRMKLGDRPVTGQGNKEAVESFFERLQEDHTGQNPTRPSDLHRPEEVTVEVNALVERRPVSSILRSAGFRTNLETLLRQALGPAARTSQGVGNGNHHRNRTHSPRESTQAAPSNVAGGIPSPPPLSGYTSPSSPPPMSVPEPQTEHTSPVSPLVGQQTTHQHTPAPRQTRTSDRRQSPPVQQWVPPMASQTQRPGSPVPDQWLQHQVSVSGPDSRVDGVPESYFLEEAQREDLIADISDLVQRELVTSSLRSRFRGQLEHLMADHMRTNNSDGARVRQVIQSLPSSGIPHNDFSHLGINVEPTGSGSDDISIISATAAVAVPHAQNAMMSRELASVKTQLQELRSMMRLSFDLQLDIQRAIRQEVAAAVSSALADAPAQPSPQKPSAASGSSGTSRPISESQCLICIDAQVDSVLYQCGHMCVCYKCGLDLRSRRSHCPVCRAPIRDIIRAYRSNED